MSTTETERPQFYEGQYLGAADLSDAVAYGRAADRRHALGAHTWGIAAGLRLTEIPSPDGTLGVVLTPGYAWDGFGRPVVVLRPFTLPASFFQAITDPTHNADGIAIDVWLRYAEAETRPAADGFGGCDDEGRNTRVAETFALAVGLRTSIASQRDPLTVAGKTIDAAGVFGTAEPLEDASVSFQTLPDDERALWLIPLGKVQWKPGVGGAAGAFVKRPPGVLDASAAARQYVGVVCGTVAAAADEIRVKHRTANFADAAHHDRELLAIEGNVAAQGDLRPWGKRVDFRDDAGRDHGTPLTLHRADSSTGERRLSAAIGNVAGGLNRFSVGPYNAAQTDVVERFAVLDNGNVGIGTVHPDRLLTVQGAGDALINARTNHALPRELTLGANADGGLIATASVDPLRLGAGGNAVMMTILPNGDIGIGTQNPAHRLHVVGDRLRLEGGGKTIDLRTNGSAVDLQSNTSDLYLRASGPPGNNRVLINPFPKSILNPGPDYTDGFVGIGTLDPQARLQVNGSIRLGHDGEYFAPAAPAHSLLILRGNVTALGGYVANAGYKVKKDPFHAGLYTIDFDVAFLDTPSATLTPIAAGAANAVAAQFTAVIIDIDAARLIVQTSSTAGTVADQAFSFIVMGVRP